MLEYVMLGFFLAIYTRKYWLKYFKRVGTMKYLVKIWYSVSIILLIMGCIGYILGELFASDKGIDNGQFIFSIGIASFAIFLAFASTRVMKAISNVQFLELTDMIENARVHYIGGRYGPDLFGWKTHNFVKMAVEFLEVDNKKGNYIKSDYQDLLFHYFNISFKHLFKYPRWVQDSESVNTGISNFTKAYAMLEDYYNDARKSEFDRDLKLEPKIDHNEFYSRVGEIKRTKKYDIS